MTLNRLIMELSELRRAYGGETPVQLLEEISDRRHRYNVLPVVVRSLKSPTDKVIYLVPQRIS